MAVSNLIVILLLVAYVEADINSLITTFNETIKGQCKLGTTTVSSTSTAPTSTGSTSTVTLTSTASSTTATQASTASSTAASTEASSSTAQSSTATSTVAESTTDSVTILCVSEEPSVWGAKDVVEFHTKLQAYSICQKANCTSLTSSVDKLLIESGATSLKICGIFLGLMFVISYFG